MGAVRRLPLITLDGMTTWMLFFVLVVLWHAACGMVDGVMDRSSRPDLPLGVCDQQLVPGDFRFATRTCT